MLVSSIGVPIYEHICSRQGITVSFYFKSKTCCSTKKSSCHKIKVYKTDNTQSTSSELSRKPCCQDNTNFIKEATIGVKQSVISSWKQLNFEQSIFFIPIGGFVNKSAFDFRISFQHYKPPQIIFDIYQMIQHLRC